MGKEGGKSLAHGGIGAAQAQDGVAVAFYNLAIAVADEELLDGCAECVVNGYARLDLFFGCGGKNLLREFTCERMRGCARAPV